MTALRRLLPFLNWFPLQPGALKADLIAGLTVSLLVIPQALAYAQLAGVPAYYGLYAALLPTIIGALFGSSALLSTGPVALTALLTAASIAQLGAQGGEQYMSYAILLALIAGVFQLTFGLLRMGAVLNFLSYPVLMGFINAAAIIIGLSQLPALLGLPLTQTSHFVLDIWQVMQRLDTLHPASLIFGAAALALLIAFKRQAPRLPGVLITVVLLTVTSELAGFENMGGRVVGDIPHGLPAFAVPHIDWDTAVKLLPAGFIIALISFMEAMSSCKIIAIKTRKPWDENQELIGQGLAKIAGAFSQTIPVSGSFSRSALNLSVQAQTGLSSIFSALCVLPALLFFTPLLHHLPKPVLAAIIITALANLIDFGSIVKAWRARRDDGFAAVVTFVATLAFAPGIQTGILCGIVLSVALLLYRMMRPRAVVVGMHADGTLRDAAYFQLDAPHPKMRVLRFDRSLFFVNASYFEDAVITLARNHPELRYILVAGGGINEIDASGIEVLSNLSTRLKAGGITLGLSGIKRQVMSVMTRTGLTGHLGAENIFATDRLALDTLCTRLNTESTSGR